MKANEKRRAEIDELFSDVKVSINPKLSDVNKSGIAKKIADARKILSSAKLPAALK